MPPYRQDVFLLCVGFITIINGCYYNDCNCIDEVVYCELTDDSELLFSFDEMIDIEELDITRTQIEWITNQCATFPRLSRVLLLDGSLCPQDLCVPCT